MSAGCNFDGAMSGCYANQTEAYNQHIGRQREIRDFRKQRALIIHVGFLYPGPQEWYLATPLVSYYPLVHNTADDTQHAGVEE